MESLKPEVKMSLFFIIILVMTMANYCVTSPISKKSAFKPTLDLENVEQRDLKTGDVIDSILDETKIELIKRELRKLNQEAIDFLEVLGQMANETVNSREKLGYVGRPHMEDQPDKKRPKRSLSSIISSFFKFLAKLFGGTVDDVMKIVATNVDDLANLGKGLQKPIMEATKMGTLISKSQLNKNKPFDEIDLKTPKPAEIVFTNQGTEPIAFDCSLEDPFCLETLKGQNTRKALPGKFNYHVTVHNLFKDSKIYLHTLGSSSKTISIEYDKKHIFMGFNFNQNFKLIVNFSTPVNKVSDVTSCPLVDKNNNVNIIYDFWPDGIYKTKNGGKSTIWKCQS